MKTLQRLREGLNDIYCVLAGPEKSVTSQDDLFASQEAEVPLHPLQREPFQPPGKDKYLVGRGIVKSLAPTRMSILGEAL